jgi:hypothetical protein
MVNYLFRAPGTFRRGGHFAAQTELEPGNAGRAVGSDAANVEPADTLVPQQVERPPEQQVLGAQLAPAGRDVADLVGRRRAVADDEDAGERGSAFAGEQRQELAVLVAMPLSRTWSETPAGDYDPMIGPMLASVVG